MTVSIPGHARQPLAVVDRGTPAFYAIGVIGAIALGASLSPVRKELAAAGLMLMFLPVLLSLILRPTVAFGAWLFATGAFSVPLAQVSVQAGPRFYLLDVALMGAAAAAAIYSLQRDGSRAGPRGHPERWALALAVVGGFVLLEAARGLGAGHSVADTFGTVRRMVVYPAAGFFTAWTFFRTPEDGRLLSRALLSACAALALVMAMRVLTGTGYRAEAFEANQDVVRYLSYPEALTLITGASLALGSWIWSPEGPARRRWLLLGGAFAILVVASNYRTSWLALAFAFLCVTMATAFRRKGKGLRLLAMSLAGGGLLIGVLLLTPLRAMLVQKLARGNLMNTGIWRAFSWLKAWRVFLGHPVLGVGLGYQHTFVYPNATLTSLNRVSGPDIHNDALWVLVNTGMVGMSLALAGLVLLLIVVGRVLRGNDDWRVLALACAACGQLGAVAVTSMFQPTLSLGGTGVWLGTVAAYVVMCGATLRGRTRQGADVARGRPG